jgi:phospho-N-acetylmuramoyl-pentapeptide-transferase
MIFNILLILLSFSVTFLVTIPFIKLLYKFNIRRVSKAELDSLLPGRQVKLGTPIMGGAVILITIIVLSTIFLSDWEYYWAAICLVVLGGIVGAIDEYMNTLGRTFKAIRISTGGSLFNFHHESLAHKIKNIILKPWQWFEEFLRMMGSNQRGFGSHYKFLSHILVAMTAISFLMINEHITVFHITSWLSIPLGIIYYPVILFLMLFTANAFGITDGMDGLSAGMHFVSFTVLGILAYVLGYEEVSILAFIIAGAELAFLYFNINPARMEMSDVGTVPLGMLFFFLGILISEEFGILLIGLIYMIEILSSILQVLSVKYRGGKRIFLVAPIHHHFEKMGWPETKVTQRFWIINILFALVGAILVLF